MSYSVGRAGGFFSRKIYTEAEPDAGRSALAFQQPARPAAGEQAGVSNEAMLRSFDFGFEPREGAPGANQHGGPLGSFDFELPKDQGASEASQHGGPLGSFDFGFAKYQGAPEASQHGAPLGSFDFGFPKDQDAPEAGQHGAPLGSFDFGFAKDQGAPEASQHGAPLGSFDFGFAPHDNAGGRHPLSSQATNPAVRPSAQDSHSAESSADWGSRSRLVPPRRQVREASGGLPTIPEEARQPESTALKAKKETPQAPPGATKPTRFAVPERAFADVLTQPFELNSNRLNPVTEFVRAPGRQPIAAAAYGTSATGSANRTLQEGAFGVLAGQRGLSALTYAFNAATSHGKKQRYTKMLDGLLQEDVDKFNGSVAAGKREDEAARARTGVSGLPSRAYPRQDTMILTKDNKGNFAYDMDKVLKAASSKDPKTAETSLHAKDILLADHIANQIAGKQRNRAIYGFAHSATATVGAGIVAAASHGTSVAADGTLRAVGYGVTGASGIDPARLIRGVKRSMREKKALKVKSAELVNRQGFAQESRDGFRVPGVDVRTVDSRTGEIRIADRVPSRAVPVSEVPDKAINAVSGALQDRAVRSVEKNNVFGGIFPAAR